MPCKKISYQKNFLFKKKKVINALFNTYNSNLNFIKPKLDNLEQFHFGTTLFYGQSDWLGLIGSAYSDQ